MHGHDRQGLEGFCRYGARGPVAESRLPRIGDAAMRFGAAAVHALDDGFTNVMISLALPQYVPLDSDTLLTGRDIGICFGD